MLSLKEIEHALCEFSKYHRMKNMMNKKERVKGMRTYTSLSHLDADKECQSCSKAMKTCNGVLCDTCNNFFCKKCEQSASATCTAWCCHHCESFEKRYLNMFTTAEITKT
jgi:hypothetical protein